MPHRGIELVGLLRIEESGGGRIQDPNDSSSTPKVDRAARRRGARAEPRRAHRLFSPAVIVHYYHCVAPSFPRLPSANVLVTDGEERSALAAVVRWAAPATACTRARRVTARWQPRHDTATSRHRPRARWRIQTVPRRLAALLDRWKVDVLLPVSEQALRTLLAGAIPGHGASAFRFRAMTSSPACPTRASSCGAVRDSVSPRRHSRCCSSRLSSTPSRPR